MAYDPHPMQQIRLDAKGVARFRENAIVRYLLTKGPHDLNHLATLGFSDEDQEQFAQLIGYSVSGFGELPYVSDEACEAADAIAERLIASETMVDPYFARTTVPHSTAGHSDGFRIKGKPGDRYVVSGNGFESRGSWYMEPRLKEMQADGTWLDIGTVAEVEAREKTPG